MCTFFQEVENPMIIRGSSLFFKFNREKYNDQHDDFNTLTPEQIEKIVDIQLIDFGWMDRIPETWKDLGFIKGLEEIIKLI